jgi:site-specific recombinase XerD
MVTDSTLNNLISPKKSTTNRVKNANLEAFSLSKEAEKTSTQRGKVPLKTNSLFAKNAELTWEDAHREFGLHLQATRAKNTFRFYNVLLRQLIDWAGENDVTLDQFGKRHMDRYLIFRAESGKKPMTLRHDAVATKAFFGWCVKNDLAPRNPLSDYEIRRAPRPAQHIPTDDDVRDMLKALQAYWNVTSNPIIRHQAHAKRLFHRERNYAILLGLLDTACRIGEMLSLKIDDIKIKEREIVIRESKGREPRAIPISADWIAVVQVWLKMRDKVMANTEDDEGWLFVSEYGTRVDETHFLKTLKKVLIYGELSDKMTLHSLRRYSLNRMAKVNLLATQQIAGHKEPKTTLLYTKLDADFVREVHTSVNVVKNLLNSKREVRRKRLL